MPSMSMPKNVTILHKVRDGVYQGDVRYTMSGKWNVSVTVSIRDNVVTNHSIPITVH
jgi:uncharacterized protein with FMN-binding domain